MPPKILSINISEGVVLPSKEEKEIIVAFLTCWLLEFQQKKKKYNELHNFVKLKTTNFT